MQILTRNISSISELKANPMKVLEDAKGEAVTILNHNKPVFYCIPIDVYESMNSPLPNYTNEELQSEIKDRIKEAKEHPETLLTLEDLNQKIRENLLKQL